MYTKRVLIMDSNHILETIKTDSHYRKVLKKMEVWTVDEFRTKLKTTEDTLFYAMGHEFYETICEMNEKGETHIGLRGFNYLDFMTLAFVHLGKNRLIYDPAKDFYKYEADEGKVTKKWKFSSELLYENYDNDRERLEFFLSENCEKVYLEYPVTKIVGLHEGKEILHKLDIYTVHKYDTAIDYDWVNNPENRIWENEFGFDFETFNSYGTNKGKAFPEFYGTRCAGFALSWCDPESNKSKAVFFDFRLDYDYNEDNWDNDPKYKREYYEFLNVMRSFFDNHYKHIWAYNASFEYAMLYALLRKFYYIQDSYALCIADDHRSSLKFNAQYYLRSPSWDDELDADFDYFRQICGTFNSFDDFEKYEKKYYELIEDGLTLDDLKDKLKIEKDKKKEIEKEIRKKYGWKVKDNKEEIKEKFEMTKCFTRLERLEEQFNFYLELNKKDPRFIEAIKFFSEENPTKRSLLKQHWGDEWGATGVTKNNTEYGTKEENCLGLYCGIDAFVGERLARLLTPAYGNNCYTEILNHRYIGSELKMSGIKVDKKKLLELYRFCWNVDNNYELSTNIFANKLQEEYIFPENKRLYKKLTDEQKYWLIKYPYYFTGSRSRAGGAVILDVYSRLYKDYLEKGEINPDYIPIKEIYKSIGKKVSDERVTELIEEYDLEEFTIGKFNVESSKNNLSESSKKNHELFRSVIGKIILKKLEIPEMIKYFNEFALSILKDKYITEFYDQTAVYWIYGKTFKLKDTRKLIGEKDGYPEFICLFDLLEDNNKNKKLLSKWFPEVTEKMLKELRTMPLEFLDKFKIIVPIKDDDYINSFIDKYPWDSWIFNIADLFGDEYKDKLPSYGYFLDDLSLFKSEENIWKSSTKTNIKVTKDTIENGNLIYENKDGKKSYIVDEYLNTAIITQDNANINLYESLLDKNGNRVSYEKEKIYNYFSPNDIDSFFGYMVGRYNYYDYGLAIRSVATCFDKWVDYNKLNIDKKLSKVDSKYIWKSMLDFLNNPEYRNLIINEPIFTNKFVYTKDDSEELKKEYDWFGKIDKDGRIGIDTVYNKDTWSSKDALDNCCKVYKVIPHLFNTKTGIYNFFKVDGRILPPIIEEVLSELPKENYDLYKMQLSRIWDLVHQGFTRQLAATCHKLITTYIPALDMGYVKHFYKENLDETGNDTQYGNWEYYPEYTLGTSKDGRKTLAERKGLDYLFSEDCENWFVNELPDLWCLPPYILNMVETKRNSSAFHTYRHESDYMKCLKTNYDDYLKCYFDKQLENKCRG